MYFRELLKIQAPSLTTVPTSRVLPVPTKWRKGTVGNLMHELVVYGFNQVCVKGLLHVQQKCKDTRLKKQTTLDHQTLTGIRHGCGSSRALDHEMDC